MLRLISYITSPEWHSEMKLTRMYEHRRIQGEASFRDLTNFLLQMSRNIFLWNFALCFMWVGRRLSEKTLLLYLSDGGHIKISYLIIFR